MATARRVSEGGRTKVLFILDAFPDPHAGTEGQFWLLLNRLDRERFAPSVLLLRPSPFLQANLKDTPLEVLNVSRLKSLSGLRRIWSAARRARQAGFRLAHIFFNDSAIAFPLPLRLAGLRVIASRRDLGFWYTRGNLPLLRFNARFIDSIVANCKAVKDVVVAQEHYRAERVQVIYNGITRSEPRSDVAAARSGLPDAARTIAIVANLRPLKRIVDAITALAQLGPDAADVNLVVVGEDRDNDGGTSHRQELEQLAASLGVAGRVRFTGKLSDPMPVISASSVCVLCSETEGLSNAIIEYMFAGKPVVCTDAGGNAELVQDGVNGYVVRIGDPSALAAALRRVLESPALSQQFGSKSAEIALSLFDPQSMVHQHMRLYDRLVAGAP